MFYFFYSEVYSPDNDIVLNTPRGMNRTFYDRVIDLNFFLYSEMNSPEDWIEHFYQGVKIYESKTNVAFILTIMEDDYYYDYYYEYYIALNQSAFNYTLINWVVGQFWKKLTPVYLELTSLCSVNSENLGQCFPELTSYPVN